MCLAGINIVGGRRIYVFQVIYAAMGGRKILFWKIQSSQLVVGLVEILLLCENG